jgi:hypothetical protein
MNRNSPLFQELMEDLLPRIKANNKIGFFISGGFDSGLLLYSACLVCEINGIDPNFVVLTIPRYDDSIVHAARIIDWINQRFNLTLDLIQVGNPDLHHSKQILSGCQDAEKYNYADLFLLAETTNPKILPNGPIRSRSPSPRFYQPWFDKTKDHTVALSLELGVKELQKISHTCTQSKTIRCKQCWQCQERAWAFSSLGVVDIGTM